MSRIEWKTWRLSFDTHQHGSSQVEFMEKLSDEYMDF